MGLFVLFDFRFYMLFISMLVGLGLGSSLGEPVKEPYDFFYGSRVHEKPIPTFRAYAPKQKGSVPAASQFAERVREKPSTLSSIDRTIRAYPLVGKVISLAAQEAKMLAFLSMSDFASRLIMSACGVSLDAHLYVGQYLLLPYAGYIAKRLMTGVFYQSLQFASAFSQPRKTADLNDRETQKSSSTKSGYAKHAGKYLYTLARAGYQNLTLSNCRAFGYKLVALTVSDQVARALVSGETSYAKYYINKKILSRHIYQILSPTLPPVVSDASSIRTSGEVEGENFGSNTQVLGKVIYDGIVKESYAVGLLAASDYMARFILNSFGISHESFLHLTDSIALPYGGYLLKKLTTELLYRSIKGAALKWAEPPQPIIEDPIEVVLRAQGIRPGSVARDVWKKARTLYAYVLDGYNHLTLRAFKHFGYRLAALSLSDYLARSQIHCEGSYLKYYISKKILSRHLYNIVAPRGRQATPKTPTEPTQANTRARRGAQ